MNKSFKKNYLAPAVIRQTDIAPREALLDGSIVDTATVTSIGQETEDYDFSGSGFNHNWQ